MARIRDRLLWAGYDAALTDAFLIAGWLADGQLLAGRIPLHLDAARNAMAPVAEGLGLSVEAAADAAIALAIAVMAAETSGVLAQRGVDAPEFSLVAYGGAGPLIGALLAEAVYIDRMILPQTPGVLSALGAVSADLEIDLIRPVYSRLSAIEGRDLQAILEDMETEADACFREESQELPIVGREIIYAADMRYEGQGFDVNVALDARWLAGGDLVSIANAFHEAHRRTYGYAKERNPIWLKEVRAHVVGTTPKPVGAEVAPGTGPSLSARARCASVASRVRAVSITAAETGAGDTFEGPAVVEQQDTTVLVPRGGSPDNPVRKCWFSNGPKRNGDCEGGGLMMIQSVLDEVLANHFRAVVEEMSHLVLRAAHTTFVKETQDYATALITVKGEAFAYPYKTGVTSLMGIPVQTGIASFDDWQPGDVMITNDPYATRGMVMHLPDLHLLKPVFHEGKLVCFAWAFMHCSDVGGMVPGSTDMLAYELFQEGFRLRPVKLIRGG